MLKALKDTVVQCKTKEEYEKLIDLYVENGWVWESSEPRGSGGFDEWTRDGSKMYVECNNLWCRYSSKHPFKIISVAEFLSLQGLTADGTTEELKEGDLEVDDWIECVRNYNREVETGSSRNHPDMRKGERFCIQIIDLASDELRYRVDGEPVWLDEDELKFFRKIPAPAKKKAFGERKVHGSDMVSTLTADGVCLESPTSIPKPRMSFVDYFNNSVLSSEERALRKHGIKNNSGLTCEGEKFVLAFLADKFKPELVKKVKELAKERKAEDDED